MSPFDIKIGYVPYLPDLTQPADRRRFPLFAKRNGISFSIADVSEQYDLIILTAPSNLSKWLLYKKKHPETKFIFEIVDSLIFPSDLFSSLFKGVGRYILRKEDLLFLNYTKLFFQWFKMADVIVCSNLVLKKRAEKWNKNVIISLDYLENEYRFLKTDYSIQGKLKLLWEGQGIVLRHLVHFKELFKEVNDFCELHIITSKKYPSFGNLFRHKIRKITDKLPIRTFVYEWDLEKNKDIFKACDCGIIPLNSKNLLGWYKPANKLISFWFSGLPTVVSNTPAYVDIMEKAHSNLYCADVNDWIDNLKRIKSMTSEERKDIAEKNYVFSKQNFSNEVLDQIWFRIFEKVEK